MTNGYELITGLTNLLIFIIALILFFKINNKDWKIFYFLMCICSLLGVLIHGINFSKEIIYYFWIVLSFFFCLTLNVLISIFTNKSKLFVILLTCIIYFIIILENIFHIDFLLSFIIYACVSLFLILYMILKKKYNYNYLIGTFLQFIGGIFLLNKSFKISLLYLDKNGIYHLFMALTLIYFYKGIISNDLQ